MILSKSKNPMKKRMSGIILAAEIAAIMVLHAHKMNHHQRNDGVQKMDEFSQQLKISHSYSYSNLK